MDGDDMGQWVSGCKGSQGDLDPLQPGYQGKLSAKLSAFASAVPAIMAKYAGQAIYCGGDDVLAMLPAAQALKCAQDLANIFSQHLPGGTTSVGIAIGHVRAPLQDTIQAAREAEKAAKAVPGKNAFCLRILKHSGESAEFAARFDSGIVGVWDELSIEIHDLSGRFAYRYLSLIKPLLSRSGKDGDYGWERTWTTDLIDACEAELRHVLIQQGGQEAVAAEDNAKRWIAAIVGSATSPNLTPKGFIHLWMAWAFANRITKN
jgi:CRISPR/Cas system-associated protein Cas10 (large subunit of type III CRISPR-Cas system)